MVLVGLIWPPSAAAQARDASGPGPSGAGDALHLLRVPFVPQPEALCGGAAAAMVFRYWGEAAAAPERFADLVVPDERGIPTADLAGRVRELGWQAIAFVGDADEVGRQLARGRPVIALLEVEREVYHYVVVVGWSRHRAVFHDPARSAYRVLPAGEFDRAWEGAGRWALLALPRPATSAVAAAAVRPGRSADEASSSRSAGILDSPCRGLAARGVRLARGGALDSAATALENAVETCGDHVALRELAGLRLLQRRPRAAVALVRRALAMAPEDRHSLSTLATAHYLAGEELLALDSWRRLGATRIDLVQVAGLRRTRHMSAAGLMGLEPGRSLGAADLIAARRRLALLPVAAGSRVGYRPLPGGAVRVEAAIRERDLLPSGMAALVGAGARAALEGEIGIRVAGLAGAGEVWGLTWRWPPARKRVAVELAMPGSVGVPVVWRLEGARERQTFVGFALADARVPGSGGRGGRPGARPGYTVEERTTARLGLDSWAGPRLRWAGDLSLDRWADRGSHLAFSGEVEHRSVDDRFSATGEIRGWAPLTADAAFSAAAVRAAWRSRVRREGTVFLTRFHAAWVAGAAPRSLWPGAGTGRGRAPLLRAHPLLRDDVVSRDAVLGRRLMGAGAEAVRWLLPGSLPLRVGLAGFVDVARAWERASGDGGAEGVDVGIGLRLGLVGDAAALRIDATRGIVDGAFALSAGLDTPWPGR